MGTYIKSNETCKSDDLTGITHWSQVVVTGGTHGIPDYPEI